MGYTIYTIDEVPQETEDKRPITLIHRPISFKDHPGANTEAIIDTGTSDNFIGLSYLKENNIEYEERPDEYHQDALGRTMPILGKLRLRSKVQGNTKITWKGDVDFLVMDLKRVTILLGRLWLNEANPIIDFRRNRVVFRKKKHPFQHILTQSPHDFRHATKNAITPVYTIHLDPEVDNPAHPKIVILPTEYADYKGVFSEKKAELLPNHNAHQLHIDLEPGKLPPYGPLYNLSEQELQVLREYIDTHLKRGWIRPSTSSAGAPILFVKKKDGGLRLCVDYRGLNAITLKNRYPLPLIQESLSRLQNATIYTKLDLRDAYHRLRIKEGDEWKTAFRTRYGHFEYTVVPFGLTNAPGTFQGYINHALSDLLDVCCIVYLDDILIYSSNLEEHVQHVQNVLERLQNHQLYAKLSKCSFHQDKVDFLGYTISKNGIEMDPSRTETVRDWPIPTTVHEIRVFLGFTGYYRQFVKGYSRIALPLIKWTHKQPGQALAGRKLRQEESMTVQLDEKAIQSFQQLKESFLRAPILAHFDPKRPTKVETDASSYAISGIISQLMPNHDNKLQWRPIAFYSRKMTPAERNYDIHDQELLAIIASLKQWRHFLEGHLHPFELHTDHANLQGFMTIKSLTRRQTRWAEWLSSFHFTVKYKKGNLNPADPPSRRPDYAKAAQKSEQDIRFGARMLYTLQEKLQLPKIDRLPKGRSTENLLFINNQGSHKDHTQKETFLSSSKDDNIYDKIRKEQEIDVYAQNIKKQLQLEEHNRPLWVKAWQDTPILKYREKVYVPEGKTRLKLLEQFHDDPMAGHFGISKTIEKITRIFYWPKMSQYVKDYVSTCPLCNHSKPRRFQKHGQLRPLPIPNGPWEDITMDLITELPESEYLHQTYNSILVIIDRYTKMAHYTPTRTTITAVDLAQIVLREVVRLHGTPRSITSDRGPIFTSAYWNEFCNHLHTKRQLSTAFHPQTDGQTERQNQTLEQYLRIFCNMEQDNWAQLLPYAEFAYNDAQHSATKQTPFFTNSGYHPTSPIQAKIGQFKPSIPGAEELAKDFQGRNQSLKKNLEIAQKMQKKYYDQKHKPKTFQVGELVLLDTRNVRTQRPSKKLDYKYDGPFKIKEIINPQAYKLDLPQRLRIHPVFHISLLQSYTPDRFAKYRKNQPLQVVSLDTENVYEVDHIRDRRRKPDGTWEYLIHWKGYDSEEDQWEPSLNISKQAREQYLQSIHHNHTTGTSGKRKRQTGQNGTKHSQPKRIQHKYHQSH